MFEFLGKFIDIQNLFFGLPKEISILAILDIIIVASLIYWLYVVIKDTKAIRILYGILVIFIALVLSSVLKLSALNWISQQFITMLVVAIPIVFQPELRRALERLGQARFFGNLRGRDEVENMVLRVLAAVKVFARRKIGALIIFKRNSSLDEIIATGIRINADASKELLANLFFPKSPLHDGAVIISGNKILAAGCTLPLSDIGIISGLGLRHRAGLGVTEQTDALAVVVSEERGTISFVKEGKISSDIEIDKLEKTLVKLLKEKPITNLQVGK